MNYLFVDRRGSQAIWGLVNPVAARLTARGDRVVFCRMDDGRQVASPPAPAGVETLDFSVPAKRRVWDLFGQQRHLLGQMTAILSDLRPDVVHTHFCVPGVAARLAAQRAGVPAVVSTQHEAYESMYPHYRWAVRMTEHCAQKVAYVSRSVARSFGHPVEALAAGVHGPRPRHVVIPNGVDLAEIDAARMAAGARDANKLVCVARLVPLKGHDVVLRAVSLLRQQFPALRLVLIGAGPCEQRLKRLTAKLGLTGNVEFVGWLPHQRALAEMASAAVAVVPSRGPEGFGLALAEAVASGTPAVASRVPAFAEVVGDDDRHAVLCRHRPAEMAAAVAAVLAAPETSARRAGRGRAHMIQNFTVDRMADDYLRLYDSLPICCEEVADVCC